MSDIHITPLDFVMEAIVSALRRASVRIQVAISEDAASLTSAKPLGFDASGRPEQLQLQKNASGDNVCALDVQADKIVEDELRKVDVVAGYASEEREHFVPFSVSGEYVVVCDPLDGSQNVPVGVSVGAIFGVFKASSLEDIKSGDGIVGAGYALFSSCLQFVWAESSVEMSMWKPSTQAWVTTAHQHKIPPKGKTYAINEGNANNWHMDVSTFVQTHCRGKSVRWAACMVLDVHRELKQGGLFMYPCCKKYTKGRLRLVYEAYPIAFVWEKAGGVAWDKPNHRILDVPFPNHDVHQRAGVLLMGQWEKEKFAECVESVKGIVGEWGKY